MKCFFVFTSTLIQCVCMDNYPTLFFNLTVSLRSHIQGAQNSTQPTQIHLIRIPKAGSSSLSVVARRMVGCNPPGPCCRWPGTPHGSCPSKELFACQLEGRVLGCTHHYPENEALLNTSIPSISILRHPIARSISGFIYPGIHHNSGCKGTVDDCLIEYLTNPKWTNIVVKMLTGEYAYSNAPTCKYTSDCANSMQLAMDNLQRIAFVGVVEMWELSLALFHRKFPWLHPNFAEFAMGTNSLGNARGYMTLDTSLIRRSNKNNNNAKFNAYVRTKYFQELQQQNALDLVVYKKVIENMCNDMHTFQLWNFSSVRQYWRANAPYNITKCL